MAENVGMETKWTHLERPATKKFLIINPNSSQAMTAAMVEKLYDLPISNDIEIKTYTAPPPSPPSINNEADSDASAAVVMSDMFDFVILPGSEVAGVLVACFSHHPLVQMLTQLLNKHDLDTPVVGIFEASIRAAQTMPWSWGIVTTGAFWEAQLDKDARKFIVGGDTGPLSRYAGVFGTGLDAADFHAVGKDEVRRRLADATRRLLGTRKVRCVIMGCAGMAGLEAIIREVAVEVYGPEGNSILVIDAVKAGVMQLDQIVKYNTVFR